MQQRIYFEEFEGIKEKLYGKTVTMLFNGSIKEVRQFENFELAGHKQGIGYFMGNTEDGDLDVEFSKEEIDYILKDVDDLESDNEDYVRLSIHFNNGDLLQLSCWVNNQKEGE